MQPVDTMLTPADIAARLTGAMTPLIVHDDSMRKKGTQEGSVRLKDGKWRGSYSRHVSDLHGNITYKRTEVTLDATTKRGAKAELRDKYVAVANAQAAVPEGAATLEQFIEARFKSDRIAQLRTGGQIHYKSQLKHILPTLGGIQLRDISPVYVQQLIMAKGQSGLSAQSVKHIRNALSAILGYARDLGFIEGRLATEAARLPRGAAVERRALTVEQAKLLLAAASPKYRPVLQFFLSTGARASEAAGLRWQDINLTDSPAILSGEARMPYMVHFRHAWKFGKYEELKTRASKRDVPMTAALWVELQTMYEQRDPASDIVFSAVRSRKQKRVPMDMHNLLTKMLKPLGEKLGMPWLNLHILRHTTSTWLDVSGAPMGQKILLMGHTSTKVTMGYTHAEMDSQREALEKSETKLMVS
jgi:hypothetical protein